MANPYIDAPPAGFRLRAAPLERVLAAIAFPTILKIGDPSGVGASDFQEKIRKEYPHLKSEQESALQIQAAPNGAMQTAVVQRPVWRFYDQERHWRATLTADSIALETQRHYTVRDDFLARLERLVTRLGFRYLNVFGPEKFAKLESYVRPDFLTLASQPSLQHLQFSTSVANFVVPEGTLIVKHGILEAGMQHEFMDGPVPDRRWFLDLDVWTDAAIPFETVAIKEQSIGLTGRICSFFSWAMTPVFMDDYRDTAAGI